MWDAGESVDDGRDNAGHGGGGDVGWWRTETCWEKGVLLLDHERSICIALHDTAKQF